MNVHATALTKAQHLDEQTSAFAGDVIEGLSQHPKRLSPKYFYDAAGSELFEQITVLPEYYPTRTELGILRERAGEIAAIVPKGAALVEFGAGSTTKVRLLLEQCAFAAYVPVDISGDFLKAQADALRRDFPQLAVHPVTADFTAPFALPDAVGAMPKVGFFPGSTLGNFEPHDSVTFMRNAAQTIGQGGVMIMGVDLVKDPAILNAAYNDVRCLTDKFNLNLLRRINREFEGNFDLQAFEHHAVFNRERRRIEMHLASKKRQKVSVAGRMFTFRAGETIHTENSYKYSRDSFSALARGAGWTMEQVWTDANQNFAVCALTLA